MHCMIEKIGIHILAFFVARCHLLGMYPFVVPFFMAAFLQNRSSMSMFVALMLGVLSKMGWQAAIRYGLVLLFLLVLLKRTDRKTVFSNNYQIALATGMVLWSISMPFQYVVTGNDTILVYAFLEGVIAASFVLIFEQAFVALRVGTKRMYANNERFIGLFALTAVVLFGCPVIVSPINVLFALCSMLLLYNSYRFDSGVGMATGAVTGLVLAFQLGLVNYLAVMILLSTVITLLKGIGKVGVLLGYFAGYVLLGILYDKALLQNDMLWSVVIVTALFLVIPNAWMKQVAQMKEGGTGYSQDILIQEATRSRIYDFGQAFLSMEKMLQAHEEERSDFESHGLSNIYLSGDGISLLNVVESQSNRLTELRRNFIRQLGQVGDIITAFPAELMDKSLQTEFFEVRVTESFARLGVGVTKAIIIKDGEERVKVYIGCYLLRERMVHGEALAERVGRILGRKMVCVERGLDVVTKQESSFSFVEQGSYMMTTGIVRKNRNGEEMCGDNFSVTKIDTQKAVLMLSDGMGTGEKAHMKSEQVVGLLEQLLMAGFRKDLAVELLNSFISFLTEGELSSSLDLTVVDFYTGNADFMKLGASTTFIKRKDKVECIRSTSLPVGVLEQAEFDTCSRKLYHSDMIIMVSDGVLDGIIFEDKEEYLADVIAKQNTQNVQVMAEAIMREVEKMQRGTLRDDSTIIIAGIWEQ